MRLIARGYSGYLFCQPFPPSSAFPMTGDTVNPMTFLPLVAGIGVMGTVITIIVFKCRKRDE